MQQQKPHINVVVIGHVDSGKSTTTGHLIWKCGALDKSVFERIQAEANNLRRHSLSFSFILDKLKAERERGMTIDCSFASFESPKNYFTIIDTPGHRDFIKNMITGTSQADVAILMIAGTSGEFEAGISSEGQTKEHVLLAFTLGVKQLIVCINKMDSNTVNWSETRYNETKKEVGKCLKKVGYNPEKIPFIPISGWTGDNLTEKCTVPEGSWYKGLSLIETLDNLTPPKRPTEKPLRIPVQNVYNITGVGTVIAGKVETGTLKPNTMISFGLSGTSAEANSIQMHHKEIPEALPGYNVGINVEGVSASEVKPGDVIGESNNDPPKACVDFTAQVIIINHPKGIRAGYTPVINCHTSHVSCKFEQILSKVERKTRTNEEENPEVLKNNDSGLVKMVPMKGLCIENFAEYPPLGRFAVRDMKRTVAVGVVKSVNKITK